MMNKYTHHLSVAFVVSLEKFPIIGQKKSPLEYYFPNLNRGGGFDSCICLRAVYILPKRKGQTLSSGIEYRPLENVCPQSIHILSAYPNNVCLFTVGIAL